MAKIPLNIFRVGLMLALFALALTSLVVLTEDKTHDKIIENERQALLKAINDLVDKNIYNNAILTDTLTLDDVAELGVKEAVTVYRARLDGQAVAAIFPVVAPNGYNGKITLLLAVYANGQLAGARVIDHKETPGLGDKIDVNKTDWILHFGGRSLDNPDRNRWKVKKDGGEFDQFTGATITPRAVVTAIKKGLIYFEQHQQQLFAHEKP